MDMQAKKAPLPEVIEDLIDQLRGAWRFRRVALIVAWSTALLLWIGVFLIPNTYESTAQVFVDTQTTLGEATKGLSLGDNIQSQIEQVQQALLGGPQLRKVADETNLMAGALTAAEQQEVIDKLRKNITIDGELTPQRPTAALFTISYKDHNLDRSLKVVDRLLNNFVEGSLGGKQQGSRTAERFLSAQIADYGRRLSDSEQRLADFKKQNVGLLPRQEGDFFSRLEQENQGLVQAKENLALAQRKLDEIRLELRAGQPFTAGKGVAAPADPGSLDTEQQIALTQQKLNQMLLKYTDKYPDVVALRQTLKQLRARQKAELAAAKKGDLGAAAELHLSANPVYQKLQERYNDQQIDIASIQQDIADREARIARLKAVMSQAPDVQARYAQLTRDYEVTKKQYDALLARLDSARLGQQAASTGIVKFDIVNPPTPIYKPVAPKRPLLILAALAVALAAGAGVAYLLHRLSPVFVSARQLGAVTGLTVLGSVGMAWVERHRIEQRKDRMAYVWGTVGLLVLAVGVLLLQGHLSNFVTELRA